MVGIQNSNYNALRGYVVLIPLPGFDKIEKPNELQFMLKLGCYALGVS